jgi:hypothetical protein
LLTGELDGAAAGRLLDFLTSLAEESLVIDLPLSASALKQVDHSQIDLSRIAWIEGRVG